MDAKLIASDPLVGQQLGDYRVLAALGTGGMGIVYEGVQPVIGKSVAIKVLQWELAANPDEARRLLSEARVVNSIRHRGIVDIFGFGQLPDGRHYLVMELLEGSPFDKVLETNAPLDPIAALSALEEVLDALGAAHEAGVIHRDLKPSNIFLVTPPSGSAYVKLLDFGLAKQAPVGAKLTPQTRSDLVVGTPHYMAPSRRAPSRSAPPPTSIPRGACCSRCSPARSPSTRRLRSRW
ncbi:MAG: serine/threonine protein kinase [Myxococcales bacterium]|nr:serine/threonine protein kinase [Myxococcales bacterium]